MANLIPGGIYSMSNFDETAYFVFIENTKIAQQFVNTNTEEFTFFMVPTFECEYRKILDEISLHLWLQPNNVKLKEEGIQEFSKTKEEMLEMIDGFLGVVDTNILKRLEDVVRFN